MSESGSNGGAQSEEVEVLRLIWNEMKSLRETFRVELQMTRDELGRRIDETNSGLDRVRAELKEEIDGLRRRMTESEVRLATATNELSGETRELAHLIRAWREEHREDRASVAARVTRIEQHLKLPPANS